MLRSLVRIRVKPLPAAHHQCCRPNSFPQHISVAAYTHRSKKHKREKSNSPLLLSVQIDPVLGKQLLAPKIGPQRKGKIKISPAAQVSLDFLKKKLENHFPGLAAAQYKIRYKIGEKMKLPRRCTTDDEARDALQECALLQLPLHITLHPDYYSSSTSSSDTTPSKSKEKEDKERNSSRSNSLPPHLPLPQYLCDMPNPDLTPSFTLVSFYRFKEVPDPDRTVASMRELWQPFKVYGRVYVAEEGVNAQMAVPTNVLRQFEIASSLLDVLRDDSGDDDAGAGEEDVGGGAAAGTHRVVGSGGFKVNCDSREMSVDEFYTHAPFRALHIRKRRQILVDGFEQPLDWISGSGGDEELAPRDWHRRVPSSSSSSSTTSFPAPIILDCRNKYESDVGRFEGAIPLDTHTFKDSWAALETLLKDKDPETPIMTYCTGGIRCVKINAYLTQKMGFNNTCRLKGGIIAYARLRKEWQDEAEEEAKAEAARPQQHGDATSVSGDIDMFASKFKGVNYVFDERMGERITDDVLSQCQSCGTPHDMFSNCKHCSIRFLQCKSCAFDLSSCCSSTCRDQYLAGLHAKEALSSKKQDHAKLLQQAKQQEHKKKRSVGNGNKSFSKSEQSRALPASGAQQRRPYSTSSLAYMNNNNTNNSGTAQDGSAVLSYCEMFSSPEPALLTSLRHETLKHCSPASQRMLCDPLQGRLLALLSLIHRPYAILELGTFTGYSALCLAEGLKGRRDRACPPFLLTVDSDVVTTRIAKKYIQQYLEERNGRTTDHSDHVHMESLDGRGADVLLELRDNKTAANEHLFDLVFLDANKKGYVDYLKLLMGESEEESASESRSSSGGEEARSGRRKANGNVMLSPGALIVVDNTLWKGMVIQEVPALAALGGEGGGGGRMQQLARALHAFNLHCREHPLLSPVLLPIRDGLTIVRYTPPSPTPLSE